MTAGSALAARSIGDAAQRDLPSEWAGPNPAAPQIALPLAGEAVRRVRLRKP